MSGDRSALERTLMTGTAGAAAANALGAVLGFASQLILARILGAKHYGNYIYPMTWLNVVMVGGLLGLDMAGLRFIPEYQVKGQWGLLRGFLRRTSVLVAGASLVVALAGAAVVRALSGTIPAELGEVFLVAAAVLPLLCLLNLTAAALRALKRVVMSRAPGMVLRPAALIAGVAAYHFFYREGPGPARAMLINLGAFAASLALARVFLFRAAPPESRTARPEYRMREWMGVMLPLMVIPAIYQIKEQVDMIIAGLFLSVADVGIYAIARKFADLITFGLIAVNMIAVPMISELHAAGRKAELQRLVTRAAWGVTAFTLPVAAVIIIFGKPLLALFGPEFDRGYVALVILCAGQMVNALAGPVGMLLVVTGHERDAAMIIGVCAAINGAASAVLVPAFGLAGAAAATAFVTVLWNGAMFVYSVRKLGINTSAFALGPGARQEGG